MSERTSEWPSTLRVDFIVILPFMKCHHGPFGRWKQLKEAYHPFHCHEKAVIATNVAVSDGSSLSTLGNRLQLKLGEKQGYTADVGQGEHNDSESLEIGTLVLGHSLVRSFVLNHCVIMRSQC